jgi:DNA-binding NarL/FixJ family response regulator
VTLDEHPLRILIVDDDAFYRRGIREILNEQEGLQVVGEAADGDQAVELARDLRSRGLDLVLMDTDMPRVDGVSTLERLVGDLPELPVVMLSGSMRDAELFDAIRAGAVGYLHKGLAPDALIRALCGFLRGESIPMSRDNAQKVLDGYRTTVSQPAPEPPPATLTRREKEVLALIARGARDREIAQRLVVTESTVKKHVQNILRKMHARNRAEAAARLR